MTDIFCRTRLLVGEKFDILQNSHVLVVGVGGVGGHTAEFLVRAGVGKITIADFDKVDISNVNRQMAALTSTVGQFKTSVLAKRFKDINPDVTVAEKNIRFCESTRQQFFDGMKFDFVVDAIDSIDDKVCLIETVQQLGLPVVSSMGAGNRIGIPSFVVKDIFETQNDGLARVLRKKLRERNIKTLPCVCDMSPPQKKVVGTVGSISYFPAAAACVLTAYVVNTLLEQL